MPVYFPRQPALTTRLAQPYRGLVVCFCAAWCDTCRSYQADFATLADATPAYVFVWADIEDYPDLLGEADVENFPTLLATVGTTPQFFGPLLPHIGHLRRLLATLTSEGTAPAVTTALPGNLLALLADMTAHQS